VSYSDFHDSGTAISGTVFETSNVGVDPLFVSAAISSDFETNDYRLATGSPAIDAGSPAYLDVDGSATDMGAYGGPYATW
jgi:hypothetical protein